MRKGMGEEEPNHTLPRETVALYIDRSILSDRHPPALQLSSAATNTEPYNDNLACLRAIA
jgi:hypothetical protein